MKIKHMKKQNYSCKHYYKQYYKIHTLHAQHIHTHIHTLLYTQHKYTHPIHSPKYLKL